VSGAVSVVVPNYNKANYLVACIASIVPQQHLHEVIVVDDASTDASWELLRSHYEGDSRVHLIRQPSNRNASACRNEGLRCARGDYVMFVDSDDLLESDCLVRRVALATAFPDHDAWVFPLAPFVENPGDRPNKWTPRAGDHLAHFLAHRLDWQTMQPLWRRNFVTALGGFDESFRRLQDVEFHARAMLAGARMRCFPDEPVDCHFRIDNARHHGNLANLPQQHLRASLHFYTTFLPLVTARYRGALSGTLLMCLSQHGTWLRLGRIARDQYDSAAQALCHACVIPTHQRILRAYAAIQRRCPLHVPGLRYAAHLILGIPR
jgi:glycosyltransferase involved in cell wall biosynthesis